MDYSIGFRGDLFSFLVVRIMNKTQYKEGDIIDTPKEMNIKSINEEKQTAMLVWIDVKSGMPCRCEVPLSELQKVEREPN